MNRIKALIFLFRIFVVAHEKYVTLIPNNILKIDLFDYLHFYTPAICADYYIDLIISYTYLLYEKYYNKSS